MEWEKKGKNAKKAPSLLIKGKRAPIKRGFKNVNCSAAFMPVDSDSNICPAASNVFCHTSQADLPLPVPVPAEQGQVPVIPFDAVSPQNLGGESQDHAALSNLISNFSVLADQFKQLVSTVNVSHAWSGQQTAQSSSSVTRPVVLDEPNLHVSEFSMVPKSCFREAMACEMSPLGFHLSANVKSKIWRGDYIDVFSLLPSVDDRSLKGETDKSADERCRLVPCTFNNWLQAFCIYASVMGERHPELCAGCFIMSRLSWRHIKNFWICHGFLMTNHFVRN